MNYCINLWKKVTAFSKIVFRFFLFRENTVYRLIFISNACFVDGHIRILWQITKVCFGGTVFSLETTV